MNSICITGNLGKDPETRTTNTGKSVTSFSVAVKGRSKDDTTWFRVQCWDKTSDYVSTYLTKGRMVAVKGRMECRKFNDKDGNQREAWELIAETVEGLDRAPEGGTPNAAPARCTRQSANPVPSADEYDPFADE